jgi:hypothetical protein
LVPVPWIRAGHPQHDDALVWIDRESEQWLPERPMPGFRTRHPPALGSLAGTLHLVCTDDNREVIVWSKLGLDGQTWLPPRAIGMPNPIDSGPTLAGAGTLHIAYRCGDDGGCWTSFNPVNETWFMLATLLSDRGTNPRARPGRGGR